jgi:hypothetical protein
MVGYDQMPGGLWLSHEMKNAVLRRQVKIKVYFHPAGMGVRRNGIPNRTLMHASQSHYQLTASDSFEVDVFIYSAFVGSFCSS